MTIRTDVSEDPKGDPTKLIPHQPVPRTGDADTEPVFPKPDGPRSDPRVKPSSETEADRRGRISKATEAPPQGR
jgi:hypothetical protein